MTSPSGTLSPNRPTFWIYDLEAVINYSIFVGLLIRRRFTFWFTALCVSSNELFPSQYFFRNCFLRPHLTSTHPTLPQSSTSPSPPHRLSSPPLPHLPTHLRSSLAARSHLRIMTIDCNKRPPPESRWPTQRIGKELKQVADARMRAKGF